MAIGDPYITRDQLKSILSIDVDNHDEDDLIDRAINGASRSIERRSGWPTFWNDPAPVTRSIPLTGKIVRVRQAGYSFDKVLLRNGIASPIGFSVSRYSQAVLMPEDSFLDGEPATAIRLSSGGSFSDSHMSVTARFGWPEVPDDVIMAAQMQSHRYYDRKGSPEGIAGSAEWGISRIPPLDPDVLAILKGGGFMRAGIG